MTSSRRFIAAPAAAATALAVLVAGSGAAQAATVPGTIVRVSNTPVGDAPNAGSSGPSVSADGRYVAYLSAATDIVPGGTPAGQTEGYVRDQSTGTTSLVTLTTAGSPIVGSVSDLSISANGRYVVYIAKATGTAHQPRKATWNQAYRYDRTTGITRAVSLSSTGGLPYGLVTTVTVSATGRYVLYGSTSRNIVPVIGRRPHPGVFVYLVDFRTGMTTEVGGGGRGTGVPVISADGRYLLYYAYGPHFFSRKHLLLIDLSQPTAPAVVLNTRYQNGQPSHEPFSDPSISADGTALTFEHFGNDLVPGMPKGVDDGVYRYDIATKTLTRISAVFDQTTPALTFGAPTISADGRFIGYPAGSGYERYDAQTGQTQLLFVDQTTATQLSGDGQHVAFSSSDPSLVGPGDTNNADDVYLWSRS